VKVFQRVALALLTGTATLALGGGEAIGQGGRSGHSTSEASSNVRPFAELSAFGRCYVRTNRNRALAFIATAPGSPEEGEFHTRWITGEQYCLSGGSGTVVSVSTIYMRGAIAEGLIRSEDGVPASLALPVPIVAEVRDLGDVARCYASGHRAEIQGLLATDVGTPQETAAVAGLWNDFRACMPQNMRVRLNAPWIRFLLVEGLLRLPRTGPTPSGN
jgi:hypothetical protein